MSFRSAIKILGEISKPDISKTALQIKTQQYVTLCKNEQIPIKQDSELNKLNQKIQHEFHSTTCHLKSKAECPKPAKKIMNTCENVPPPEIKTEAKQETRCPGSVARKPLCCPRGSYKMPNPKKNVHQDDTKKKNECRKLGMPCCPPLGRKDCYSYPDEVCQCVKQEAPVPAYSELLLKNYAYSIKCSECGPHYPLSCDRKPNPTITCDTKPPGKRRCRSLIKREIYEPSWEERPECQKKDICEAENLRPIRVDEIEANRKEIKQKEKLFVTCPGIFIKKTEQVSSTEGSNKSSSHKETKSYPGRQMEGDDTLMLTQSRSVCKKLGYDSDCKEIDMKPETTEKTGNCLDTVCGKPKK